VFAYLRTLKTWHCPHLLLSAVLLPRRPCSDRDRHLQPAGTTAANPPHAAAADEWYRHTDRQTDRTDTVPFYTPRSAYYAGSANNVQVPYVGIRFPSKTRYRPVGGRREDMPPVDGSSTVAKIAADLRPSADGSAVRTSLVAGGG